MELALGVFRIRRSPDRGSEVWFSGFALAWVALILAATQGCSNLPGWVSSPPSDRMIAVGFASCPNFASQGISEIMAKTDAEEKLEKAIEARLRSLVENWAGAVRDSSERKRLVSILSDQAFLREFVERAAAGAKKSQTYYDREEQSFYVLLVVEDPGSVLAEFTEACKKKAFETFAWAEDQRQALAERMEETRRWYAEEELEALEQLPPRPKT